MRLLDVENWSRKPQYEHFSAMADPYFGVTVAVNVTKAYAYAKQHGVSFFGKYYHDCMKAVNSVEAMKYRILDEQVVIYDVIHGSATIMREDKTYGLSFITYDDDLQLFLKYLENEKERILNSNDFYPPVNGLDCIHSSAIPWLNFTGHKEPLSGKPDSVPKIAFSKTSKVGDQVYMNVAISVNHALLDGYHVGLFVEAYQDYLNQ